MSIDWWEAEQQEAYDELVEDILRENKDEIIAEFQEDRLASFYASNPDVALPAISFFQQANELLGENNSAALVMAYSAAEYLMKAVLLKPVVIGLIHDENVDALIATIVIRSGKFRHLLFEILRAYDADIRQLTLINAPNRTLEEELLRLEDIRNRVVHRCEEASHEDAMIATKLVSTLLNEVFPILLERLGIRAEVRTS